MYFINSSLFILFVATNIPFLLDFIQTKLNNYLYRPIKKIKSMAE